MVSITRHEDAKKAKKSGLKKSDGASPITKRKEGKQKKKKEKLIKNLAEKQKEKELTEKPAQKKQKQKKKKVSEKSALRMVESIVKLRGDGE